VRAWAVAFGCLGAMAIFAATEPTYLVLESGTNSLATYNVRGELQSSVAAGARPRQMIRSLSGQYVYVAAGEDSISIVDIAEYRIYAEINLGKFHSPRAIALDRTNNRLAVVTRNPARLLLADLQARTVWRDFDVKTAAPDSVTVSPDGRWAIVSDAAAAQVAVVNTATGVTRLISMGKAPGDGVFSKDGKEFYLCIPEANAIRVIDVERQTVVANFNVGKGPAHIALTPDGNSLVYVLRGERKIGFASGKARRQLDYMILPAQPTSLDLSPDGVHAYVACEESDKFFVISTVERRIIRDVTVRPGARPVQVLAR